MCLATDFARHFYNIDKDEQKMLKYAISPSRIQLLSHNYDYITYTSLFKLYFVTKYCLINFLGQKYFCTKIYQN